MRLVRAEGVAETGIVSFLAVQGCGPDDDSVFCALRPGTRPCYMRPRLWLAVDRVL